MTKHASAKRFSYSTFEPGFMCEERFVSDSPA